MQKQDLKRRDLLIGLSASLGTILTAAPLAANVAQEKATDVEWKYVPLDPKKAADKAYKLYSEGSCMYAVFKSVMQTLAETVQTTNPLLVEKINAFPFEMLWYGHAGLGEMGSLCGSINGGAALFGLFIRNRKKCDELTQELSTWYESSALPFYVPPKDLFPEMKKTVAESIICHISIKKWRDASKAGVESPERKDRCKRLAANTAAQVVAILNRVINNEPDPELDDENVPKKLTCISCHSKGPKQDIASRMDCAICHTEEHPKVEGFKK